MKWRTLEEWGVKRCNMILDSGRLCRNRADEGGSWCPKHHRLMNRVNAWGRGINAQTRVDSDTTNEED